jgi:threonylcarbamoyladenosine tRNA methylthiotransferase MtaB
LIKVRERLPGAAIGSDIIVGFPGETDETFERSIEYFASLPLTYFHVFPFSVRRGTVAASLPDPVPGDVKKARARRMRELGAEKKADFCRGFLGRELSVLIEEQSDKKTGGRRGFSRNYLPVMVLDGDDLVNREIVVEPESVEGGWLIGKPLDARALGEDHSSKGAGNL